MARFSTPRSLPPLPKKLPAGTSGPKSEAVQQLLKTIALQNQQDQPRTFYSVRQVANNFRLPLSSVARIYKQLEREGLLSTVRGSKTTLAGRSYDRQLAVRGFVAIPTSTSCFITLQDYRVFFMRLRRELRLGGFASTTVYLAKETEQSLVERLQRYQADAVIWFLPDRQARRALPTLKDAGIRVIGVGDGPLTIPCRYEIRRSAAIAAILQAWKKEAGLKRVTVVIDESRRSAADADRIRGILEDEDVPHEFVVLPAASVKTEVARLTNNSKSGLIFLSAAASLVGFRAPESLSELLRVRRVAFVDGPLTIPFAEVPDAPCDLVFVEWQLVAERIVNDLINQEAFDPGQITTFEAEPKLRVSLRDYCEEI
jgi:DNA-binding transcriptional regulator YhcF (GntR family)